MPGGVTNSRHGIHGDEIPVGGQIPLIPLLPPNGWLNDGNPKQPDPCRGPLPARPPGRYRPAGCASFRQTSSFGTARSMRRRRMAGRPLKTSLAWHSAYWCAPHGAMPSLPSPCPHYRLRAWQMIKRKGHVAGIKGACCAGEAVWSQPRARAYPGRRASFGAGAASFTAYTPNPANPIPPPCPEPYP